MTRKLVSLLLAVILFLIPVFPVLAEERETLVLESREEAFSHWIPTSVVQQRLAGGTDYLDKYGVTRKAVIAELSAHEHDDYYLGTPLIGGDWQSPRGDISYNGEIGTNCAGFVAYVLRKCGLNTAAVLATMRSSDRFTRWESGLPYDGLSSASNYMSLAEKGKLKAYAYPSKEALLAGGQCEKGDIILRFWTDSWGGHDEDNHLMIFWGSHPRDDKVWQNASGRIYIGPMWTGDASSYIVIKFAPEKPPSPPVAGFQDVFEADWYADAVAYVEEAGVMSGTSEDRFSPAAPMTRGQLVTILWRLSGQPEDAPPAGFSDVDPEQYYALPVDWAASQEIVNGREESVFAPNDPVSREEFAAILYRWCSGRGYDMSQYALLDGYDDSASVSEYALVPMQWANASGIINGTDSRTLDPQGRTLRCQAAKIFMRLDDLKE